MTGPRDEAAALRRIEHLEECNRRLSERLMTAKRDAHHARIAGTVWGGAATLLAIALAAALLARPASADTATISGTTVTLRGSAAPGALAEIVYRNNPVNSDWDNGTYRLTHDGLDVAVVFTWDAAGMADGITISPPDGVICAPACDLALPENESGVVTLYALETVGM